MDPAELMRELGSLVKVEADAAAACRTASHTVGVVSLSRAIDRFESDHERHLRELVEVVRRLGGRAPDLAPDFKGRLLQKATGLMGSRSVEAALKALKVAEEVCARHLDAAVALDLAEDLHTLVHAQHAEALDHLRALDQWLLTRAWDEAGAPI